MSRILSLLCLNFHNISTQHHSCADVSFDYIVFLRILSILSVKNSFCIAGTHVLIIERNG
jgi:hypothetical protein